MPTRCCVPQCTKVILTKMEVKFLTSRFQMIRFCEKKWIHAIRRDVGIHFQLKWTKVCSRHFREYDFIKTLSGRRELRKNAVPSLFSWTRTSPRKRKAPTVREQFVETRRVLLSETQTNEEPVERENASESEENETNEIEGITKQDMATQTNEIRSKDDSADSDKPRKKVQSDLQNNNNRTIDVIPLHKFGFGFEAFARITSTSQPKFKFYVLQFGWLSSAK